MHAGPLSSPAAMIVKAFGVPPSTNMTESTPGAVAHKPAVMVLPVPTTLNHRPRRLLMPLVGAGATAVTNALVSTVAPV